MLKEIVGSLSRTGRSRCRLRRDRHHGSRFAADPALVPQKARALRAWHEQSTVDRARATFKARCIARQRGLRAGMCAGFVGGKIASSIFMTTVPAHFLRGRPGRPTGISKSRSRQRHRIGGPADLLLFSSSNKCAGRGLHGACNYH